MKIVRAATYVRVSTTKKAIHPANVAVYEQNTDMQRERLEEVARQRGWKITDNYTDRASGAKENRPGLDALMAGCRQGLFDVVLVWRFDRFARSVKQLVTALDEFHVLGIDFVSTQEALDTSTPMGKAMFAIIGAMAELERDIMRERIAAGMAHAAKHGTKSGKPPGRPKAVFDRSQVVNLRARGMSWSHIARELGAKRSTVRRVYGELGK
jgi:DNA invertase Pin-like site-specific DNA recombinase